MESLMMQEWITELEQQKATLAAAKRRKGEVPRTRKSSEQLTFEHWRRQMNGVQMKSGGHQMRQTFIGEAYPPSIAQLQALQPIRIRELQLETHHRGRVLYVRTFCDPLQMLSMQNLVEDDQQTPEKIAVYNIHSSVPVSKILPTGAILAIKEPYYKIAGDGDPVIRVDHPSDLICFQHGDPAVPPHFRVNSAQTALEHKLRGNKAYSACDYLEAEAQYSLAISRCDTADQQLKRDVLRNRALIYIYLNRFKLAELDAIASIISQTVDSGLKARESNGKAFFRAGRATYELQKFPDAYDWFRKCLEIDADDVDATRELRRTETRLREERGGLYDFQAMSRSLSKKRTRCDAASFLHRTHVATSSIAKGGRGLYTSQSIRAGDIILCEKAFAVAFPADDDSKTEALLNFNTNSVSAGTEVMVLRDLVRKVHYDEELASRFFDLYADGYQASAPRLVDGKVTADTFQAMAIIRRNAFGGPLVRSSDPDPPRTEQAAAMHSSSGIWIQASYINHACQSNASRAFLGDVMIVRATKDIASGAEIFMPYRNQDPNAMEMSEKTRQSWGFTCTCAICTAELNSTSDTKRRVDAIKAGIAFRDANPITFTSRPSQAVVSKAERLFKTIEDAYDGPSFQGILPRMGLVPLGSWLLQASSVSAALSSQKTIEIGSRVLQHLGLGITVSKKSKLVVDRTQFVLVAEAVDAAVHVAHAYQAKGGRHFETGKEYIALAKEWHLTLKGEMKGFNERYGL